MPSGNLSHHFIKPFYSKSNNVFFGKNTQHSLFQADMIFGIAIAKRLVHTTTEKINNK